MAHYSDIAHVIEKEVAEVREEVIVGEVMAASSRESALPAEWSAGGSGCRGRCSRRMERGSSTTRSRWCPY